MTEENLNRLIDLAIDEDIGTVDITSEATIPNDLQAEAQIAAKQQLTVAGLYTARTVFNKIDPKIEFQPDVEDGQTVTKGTTLARLSGSAKSLLSGERTALNFLQHLSGIATLTRAFVEAVNGTNVKILDTRKTIPGFRILEKYAVRIGGGENHRVGLYDRYLIKNNHISAAGGIEKAIKAAIKHRKEGVLVEVETRTMEDVNIALSSGVDIIMLDNMKPEQVKAAVTLVKGKAKLEVSGNVTLKNVLEYAKTGVDYISVGAITHSAPAADINMLIRM